MAWQTPVNTYRMFIAGKRAQQTDWVRDIILFDEDDLPRGVILFLNDDQPLPDAREFDMGNGKFQARIYMHVRDFPDCVDLLRNDKPIYLAYMNPTYVYIGNWTKEPIGEEESGP